MDKLYLLLVVLAIKVLAYRLVLAVAHAISYLQTSPTSGPDAALAIYGLIYKLVSTRDLRILPDLLTFYSRKVGKFTSVNRPIYGNLFTGSRYKKRRKFWSISIKIRKTQ